MQSKDVGKWVGDVTVDPASGAYDLSGKPARIAIDAVGKAQAFNDNFGGRLHRQGREERIASPATPTSGSSATRPSRSRSRNATR